MRACCFAASKRTEMPCTGVASPAARRPASRPACVPLPLHATIASKRVGAARISSAQRT